MRWAREWAKEGMSMDPKELLCPRRAPGHCVAAEVGGREDFSWLGQNRRMSSKTTRGCRRAQKRSSMCGDESPYGEAFGLCLGLFGQLLDGVLGSWRRDSAGGIMPLCKCLPL
jgi:hypothetical protein